VSVVRGITISMCHLTPSRVNFQGMDVSSLLARRASTAEHRTDATIHVLHQRAIVVEDFDGQLCVEGCTNAADYHWVLPNNQNAAIAEANITACARRGTPHQ
jgi:hypothetical protein